jgi:hypothetical protein
MIYLTPFFGEKVSSIFFKKPQDDLVTRVAKVIYKILEVLINLIEYSINYLISDPTPKRYFVRHKGLFRISIIAISAIGVYYGFDYIKQRFINYLNSFLPSFGFIGKEKLEHFSEYLKNLFERPNPKSKPGKNPSFNPSPSIDPEIKIIPQENMGEQRPNTDPEIKISPLESEEIQPDIKQDINNIESNITPSNKTEVSSEQMEEIKDAIIAVLNENNANLNKSSSIQSNTSESNSKNPTEKTISDNQDTTISTLEEKKAKNLADKKVENNQFYFENAKDIIYQIVEVSSAMKKIIKSGLFETSCFILDKFNVENPNEKVTFLGKLLSFCGFFGMVGSFYSSKKNENLIVSKELKSLMYHGERRAIIKKAKNEKVSFNGMRILETELMDNFKGFLDLKELDFEDYKKIKSEIEKLRKEINFRDYKKIRSEIEKIKQKLNVADYEKVRSEIEKVIKEIDKN